MNKYVIILLVLSMAGCNSAEPADSVHADDSSHEKTISVQATRFTDTYEFFIVYDTPIEGHSSSYLIYITKLETYKPVLSGALVIRDGDSETVIEQPEEPGIYHTMLDPAGDGHREMLFFFRDKTDSDTLHFTVEVADHDHEGGDHHPDHSDEHEDEAGHSEQGEVTFRKEQAWKSDFMVEEITPAPFSSVLHTGGTLQAVPGEKKHVPSLGSGILMFSNMKLVQGSRVEKGQPLFLITAGTLTGENFETRYKELRNSFLKSREEYQRHLALFRDDIISEKQMVRSRTFYMNDSVHFYTLASKASADGLTVRSPISGYIHELSVAEGQFIQEGQEVVTISSNSRLLLRADVPMQHYNRIGEVASAHFKTTYSDHTYRTEDMEGALLATGSSVAENNRFIPVYFELENDGTLLEGAYADVFLKIKRKENTLLVPEGAILEEQGFYYVYVQTGGESYTKSMVIPGESDGIHTEILEGLEPGTRVVTHGVMLLKAASMVTLDTGHGHSH